MKRRFLACGLAMTIVFSMSACGSATESSVSAASDKNTSSTEATESGSEETASSESGDSKGVIGYNYFAEGDYALDTLANNTKHGIESCGYTAQGVCDNGSLDQLVTDVENMISSGVDGLVLWIPNDSIYSTIADVCEKAKVPWVLADKVPTDKSITEKLESDYTMFKGGVTPDNYSYGVQMGEYALDQGYKTAIILASGVGDASGTPRIEGFKDIFEKGGGKVVGEQHTDDSNQAVTQAEDLYLAHTDADCIMATGASTFGTAGLEILKKYNDQHMKIVTADFDKTILQSMKDEDYIKFLIGDYLVSGTYASAILANALDGTPMTNDDGTAAYFDDVPAFSIPVEEQDLFNKYVAGDNIYSSKDIASWLGMSKEEFDTKVIQQYSLENILKAKNEEGQISDEEMQKAGLS